MCKLSHFVMESILPSQIFMLNYLSYFVLCCYTGASARPGCVKLLSSSVKWFIIFVPIFGDRTSTA